MPNFGSLIKQHNNKVLNKNRKKHETEKKACNCRGNVKCPLQGKCVIESVVYKAEVKSNEGMDAYIGSTEGTFKQRMYAHRSDMRNEKGKNRTTLTRYMWDKKERGVSTDIEWKIIRKCNKYKCGNKKCDVCLSEKLEILNAGKRGEQILNKRNELMYRCPHRRKFILNNC